MQKKIIIGSRGSKLALIYAQNAKNSILQNTNYSDSKLVDFFILILGSLVFFIIYFLLTKCLNVNKFEIFKINN